MYEKQKWHDLLFRNSMTVQDWVGCMAGFQISDSVVDLRMLTKSPQTRSHELIVVDSHSMFQAGAVGSGLDPRR